MVQDDTHPSLEDTAEINSGSSDGALIDGIREGRWVTYSAEGMVEEICYFKRGLRDGKYEVYYPSGKLYQVGGYQSDKLHGLISTLHENGVVVEEAHYMVGELSGVYRKYDEDGGLRLECRYFRGQLEGTPTEFPVLASLSPTQNASQQLDGVKKDFYASGHIHRVFNIRNGVRHGHYYEFHDNGTLALKGLYLHGNRKPGESRYDEQGTLISPEPEESKPESENGQPMMLTGGEFTEIDSSRPLPKLMRSRQAWVERHLKTPLILVTFGIATTIGWAFAFDFTSRLVEQRRARMNPIEQIHSEPKEPKVEAAPPAPPEAVDPKKKAKSKTTDEATEKKPAAQIPPKSAQD